MKIMIEVLKSAAFIVIVVSILGEVSAFQTALQPRTTFSNKKPRSSRTFPIHIGYKAPLKLVSLSLSKDKNDEDIRIPFISRMLKKLQGKEEEVGESNTLVDDGLIEIDADGGTEGSIDKEMGEEEKTESKSNAESEAAILRALAIKARLEAKKLDASLTLAKIEQLEQKASKIDNYPKRRYDLAAEAQSLMGKINSSATDSRALLAAKLNITKITPVNDTITQDRSLELTGEELQTRIEKFQNLSIEERQFLAQSNGFILDDTNVTSIVQKIYEAEQSSLPNGNKQSKNPPLSEEKRRDAVEAFQQLPPQIKDMMAKTVGFEDGKNASAVVEKLVAENRLYENENDKFSMVASTDDFDVDQIFVDLAFQERSLYINSLFPDATRKEPLDENVTTAFFSEVLGFDTFNPIGKPEPVPGGYIIRGESKVTSKEGKDDGDATIEALDKKLATSSVNGKLQLYYILDPTPPSGEEILAEEDEQPLLLVTNVDIAPSTKAWVKPVISIIGLVSIAIFALGSFSSNEIVLNELSSSSPSESFGVIALDQLVEMSLPLAFSILTIQIAHEIGHFMIAVRDGIKTGPPTVVPSLQFGLTGAITPIKSPPKNVKSLFDFAIAGPLFGLIASAIFLYSGLEMTAFLDGPARDLLPSVPVQLLRSSTLGGAVIDYLLGDGVLNSVDPYENVKLHPYAIAGFVGLMTNALSLLPVGNTDGGRISISFFGRSFTRVVHNAALFLLVVSGFFGGDEANILLCYVLFGQFWQKELEIPCRNEVDELDAARGFLAIGMSIIVMLTLVPLPQ